MTQEEKAKAYDEAIERANSLLSSNELGNAWIYKLLPELKESEDERIRKELLNYLYDVHDDNEERARWIDWLEKQCEQKPQRIVSAEAKEALYDKHDWSKKDTEMIGTLVAIFEVNYPNGFYKVNPIGTTNMQGIHSSEIIKWLKSLKDRVQPQVNVRKLIEKLEWLENTKTTIWSEDDEAMRKTTLQYLENTKGSCAAACVPYIVKCIDWLNSLKDRVQPKVELTQVDKVILEAAIAFVEHNNHFNCWRGVDKHTVLSALHSLRPQNQWKPSDEQIKVCKEVYADLLSAKGFDVGTINSELNRLEEQLKKLSEE